MKLTRETPNRRIKFDWRPIAAALRAEPREWFKLSEPHPSVTAHGIRHGMPQAFAPAGSFDAVVNGKGTWLQFVGEPVEPWTYYMGNDPRTFDELARHAAT